ncbi:hypothetical protein QWY75_09535 [Pontixanthobacter aestiaquae]|uniref:CDP-Glycerol:Poly(Glycerophosphate) glycerophosphotransferase n=1 Tax=Pontixanthobacter aestiaquae TaxID=1509367 RepID=A0A844Z5G2_9SPHN|nr:hypothetical protein [Pontixanthobacter aestiaquae]MDN3646439.1 hypothetical protein [Pontixanthobacter aestiaquae]MXO82572.1 hypothetical protein [Pontixanthobacter aestiaquae]
MPNHLKVGFLYNHDELHQVAHTAPIISALRKQCPYMAVEVLSSSDAQTAVVKRHLDPDLENPPIRALKPSKAYSLAERVIGGAAPLGRIGFLAANLDLFRSYDALVVPETTSTMLKTKFGLTGTKLIMFPHGAGDRSVGFSPEFAHFDFVMLPGNKTRERMLEAGLIREEDSAVVGYPKFDSRVAAGDAPIFGNDRPIVFYNPHFDPKLSSWYDFGLPLLEHFAEQSRYNLVVAPHVMLFRRKLLASVEHRVLRWRKEIPARFKRLDNIHIDQGSLNSVDMTYTRMADVYIGDVSSQVYEFIAQPRPAIFLNSHGAHWKDNPNYAFWKFGPVVDHAGGLDDALQQAVPLLDNYREAQEKALRQTFDLDPDRSSADRAAMAIAKFLGRE